MHCKFLTHGPVPWRRRLPHNGCPGKSAAHREGTDVRMNTMRKVGLMVVTAVLSVGVIGVAAPAHADTTWGCPTCIRPAGH